MPFSFQLLVEFFFPGLILLTSFSLTVGLVLPAQAAKMVGSFHSSSASIQVICVFVCGLVCYFLGAVINGVSNKFIRVGMAAFRRNMIRRKLGLRPDQTVDDLPEKEKRAVTLLLPTLKSHNEDDKLNELYAAARTFSAISSDRAGKLMDYHWALVRLSRATLLPLAVLALVFLLRWIIMSRAGTEAIGFLGVAILLALTFANYRYREKFLVYTALDLFFLTANSKMGKGAADTLIKRTWRQKS